MPANKKILLYSTLNPYPFWAGSENLWFDFVTDKRTLTSIAFKVMLAESPVTREKSASLIASGIETGFYRHFNNHFVERNIYRAWDKLGGRSVRTLPWYNEIDKGKYDLVWFNVAAMADLAGLSYAVALCRKRNIPYWLLLQHGYEDFFPSSDAEYKAVSDVSFSAKRFIFISQRNRAALEKAIGQPLPNAFHSVNAIPASRIGEGLRLGSAFPVQTTGKARFFNLGRFSPKEKAQHLLLESFSGSQWKEREWELNFIGVSGFGRSQLEKLISYYGLKAANIRIKEHTEMVFEAICQNDVLLMPSLSEGTPFAMVESMACGRPALGTCVGGIPELIRHGESGWLSQTTAVEGISNALEQAWLQRGHWAEMGRKAQEFISVNYNQDHSFAALLEALRNDCAA